MGGCSIWRFTDLCGSQASGKSHTLSCLLGNCLMSSNDAIMLENPLSELVFHYDTFMSDTKGSPCKAAFLSSCRDINVRVLCSPANIRSIRVSFTSASTCSPLTCSFLKETYSNLPNILIEPLQISSCHLNTKRILDFMAVSQDNGSMPLYLDTVVRILRDIRIEQQSNLAGATSIFNYRRFKEKVLGTQLSAVQLGPLSQRLDILESFMPKSETADQAGKNKSKKKGEKEGNE